MRRKKSRVTGAARRGNESRQRPNTVRIIGGTMRGRRIAYSGDVRTRPMKDRVREATFSLLGPGIRGKHAFDLFAGTGALGLEAISRGAIRATLIERHIPTVRLLQENVNSLELQSLATVVSGDTFAWSKTPDLSLAHDSVVFVSPPYDLYLSQQQEMGRLIRLFAERCLTGSLLAVECDDRFDVSLLPKAERWDVRSYPPARLAVLEITDSA